MLAKHDKRWYLWLSAIAALVCIPLFVIALLVGDLRLSFIVLTIGMVIGAVHTGPLYAAILGILEPNLRAVGTATVLFANNLIGIGFGSLFVGALSDAFAVMGQDDSLRYSMLASLIFLLFAAISLHIGSRSQFRDWYNPSTRVAPEINSQGDALD